MLPIAEIYKAIHDIPYVIMRLPKDWPNYQIGSDIDILTTKPHELMLALTKAKQKYCEPDTYLAHETLDMGPECENLGHHHFDIINISGADEYIELRFDLYDKLPYDIDLSAEMFVASYRPVKCQVDGADFFAKMPYQAAEAILRLLEYQAHPHKKHHLEWLKENL